LGPAQVLAIPLRKSRSVCVTVALKVSAPVSSKMLADPGTALKTPPNTSPQILKFALRELLIFPSDPDCIRTPSGQSGKHRETQGLQRKAVAEANLVRSSHQTSHLTSAENHNVRPRHS
jgi:hypothetical protein